MASSANAQTCDLRFATSLECGTSVYCANVQITSQSDAFKIGTSSIFFYYNEAGLSFKEYASLNYDGTANCIAGVAPAWLEQQAYTLEPGLVNITLTLTNNEFSCPEVDASTWIDVAQVCFDITDDNQTSNLSYSIENTNFNSNDPNNGTNPIAKGNFNGIDETLACAGGDDSTADSSTDGTVDGTTDSAADGTADGTSDTGSTDTIVLDDTADFGTADGSVDDIPTDLVVDGIADGVADGGSDSSGTGTESSADGTADGGTGCGNTDSGVADSGTADTSTDDLTIDCSTAPVIVISEINYNSPDVYDSGDWVELYNPNSEEIAIGGWTFSDETNQYTIPSGTVLGANEYIVIITDEDKFNFAFPMVLNYVGPADMGFSNGGEALTLTANGGCEVDFVEYDDESPWVTEPDGNGPSLTLLVLDGDNNVAANWGAAGSIGGTPGGPEVNDDECEEPNSPSIAADASELCDDGSTTVAISVAEAAPAGFSFEWVRDGSNMLAETSGTLVTSEAGVYQATLISDADSDCQSGFSNLVVITSITCGSTDGATDSGTTDTIADTASTDGTSNDSMTDMGSSDGMTDDSSMDGTTDGIMDTASTEGASDDSMTDMGSSDGMTDDSTDGTTDSGTTDTISDTATTDGTADDGASDGTTACPALTNANANPGGVCSGASVELTYELQDGDGGTLVWYDADGNVVPDPSNAIVSTNNCDGEFVSFTAVYTPATAGCAEVSISPNTVFVLPGPNNLQAVTDGCEITLQNVCAAFELTWSDSYGNVGVGNTYTANEDESGSVVFSAIMPGGFDACGPTTISVDFNCDLIANDDLIADGATDDTTDMSTDDSSMDGTTDDSMADMGATDGMTDDSSMDDSSMDTATTEGTTDDSVTDMGISDGTTDDGSADDSSADGTTDSSDDGSTDSISFEGTTDTGSLDGGTPDCTNAQVCAGMTVCTEPLTPITICPEFDCLPGSMFSLETVHSTYECGILLNGPCFVYTPLPGMEMFSPDFAAVTGYDELGNCASMQIVIEIGTCNEAPTANDDNVSTDQGDSVTVSVLPNDTDPDGDTLEVCDFSQPANGMVVLSDGQFTYTPDSGFSGNDSFTYTICDGNGGSDTATVTVTVVPNDPPVANDDSATTDEDMPVTISVLPNDSDPENDNLEICDFTQGANGSVALSGGIFTYTPNTGFFGTDTFTYTICDGNGNSDTAVVTVTVIEVEDNLPPVAVDDNFTIPANDPFTVPVTGNDSDPNGDDLTVCDYTNPINGTLALVGGDLIYTPNAGFFGNDIFTYTICDGNGESDSATVLISVDQPIDPCDDPTPCGPFAHCVTPLVSSDICFDECMIGGEVVSHHSLYGCGVQYIDNGCIRYTPLPGMEEIGVDQVTLLLTDGMSCYEIIVDLEISNCGVNTAPVANDDFTSTEDENPVVISVLPNDSDPDGDDIYVCGDYSQPMNGFVVQQGDNFVYTPNEGFEGTDSFTYQICDGNGGSDIATVFIDVTQTGCENPEVSYCVGELQPIVICPEFCALDGMSYELMDMHSVYGCSVSNLGECIRYVSIPGFSGNDIVQIVACTSNQAVCDTVMLSVQVGNCETTNNPPIADVDLVTASANSANAISVLANDSDPDGDNISICGFTQASNGSVSQNGDQMVYTPNTGYTGSDSFTYNVCDGNGGFASATVVIVVSGTIPPVTSNDDPNAQDDNISTDFETAIIISVLSNDSDPDGDVLSICSSANPMNGTVAIEGTQIIYTPDSGFSGTDSFSYQVCDGNGGTDLGNVTVVVNEEIPVVTCNVSAGTINTSDATTVCVGGDETITVNINGGGTADFAFIVTDGSGSTILDGPVTSNTFSFGGAPAGTCQIWGVWYDGINIPDDQVANITGCFALSNPINVTREECIDDCPGLGNFGEACDDGNMDTTNDTIQSDCTCAGTQVVTEDCPSLGNFGDACDDGNMDTTNDTIQSDCTCAGTQVVTEDCPGLGNFGEACDDGNMDTTNDTIQSDCSCAGTQVVTEDCPSLGNFGDACDDGNPDTENDSIQNNCTCAGTPVQTAECLVAAGSLSAVEASVCRNVDMQAIVATAPTVPSGFSTVFVLTSGSGLIIEQVAETPSFTTDVPGNYTIHTLVYNPAILDLSSLTLGVTSGIDVFGLLIEGGGSICGALDVVGAGITVEDCIVDPNENNNPSAMNDEATTLEGEAVSVSVLANDMDSDGDDLFICDLSQPANGTAQLFGSEISYTPNVGFSGSDTFTYSVCDGNEGQADATVTITVGAGNAEPTSNDDTATTDAGTAVSIDVLANDFDTDGDDVSICFNTSPANGTLSTIDNGFVYEPAAGFFGTDSFTYSICDGNGGESTATVTITVNEVVSTNNPPQASDDEVATNAGEDLIINVLSNDFEPDGDDLSICDLSTPANGSATLAANEIFYSPDAGFTGTDTFTYTICDGNGGEATATITVSVVPDDSGFVPNADDVCTGIQESIDICVEFHTDLASIVEVTTTFDCGINILNDNCFRYTPLPGFENIGDVINVEGCFEGSCVTVPVNIYVGECEGATVNESPVAVDDNGVIMQGENIEFNVLDNDSDPEGDSLAICDFTQPSNGVVDFVGGIFTYIPDPLFTGEDNFSYTICDGNGGSAIGLVSILVNTLESDCNQIVPSFCTTPIDPSNPNPLQVCLDFCNPDVAIVDLVSTYHCAVQTDEDAGPNCFIYTPLPLFTGDDYVQAQACDAAGNCEILLVNVTVAVDCGGGKLPEESLKSAKCELNIPNVLTPNGDGMNDLLKIEAANCLNDIDFTVEIFDTYGNMIQTMRVENTYELWDGKNKNGSFVEPGTYFYVIKPNNSNDFRQISKGFIEVRR